MLELTPSLIAGLPQNGPTDPIEYYRRPVVGWLYRERINRGLRLLPDRRFERALEVGYGAGAVQLALAPGVKELHGIDLDADPTTVAPILARHGQTSLLKQGSVYELPYEDGYFDLAASFSTFEHLHEYPRALREVARVLKPRGLFLLGMPAVNKAMEFGFRAIGFKGIEDHHVTTPADVSREFRGAGFRVVKQHHLDLPLRRPAGLRVYYNWLLEKTASS
jgi:ubiquinone/menaquinone biosynthesis C-methylase UbiE